MNQSERRHFLIDYLIKEKQEYKTIRVPSSSNDQKQLLRALMNVRMPGKISNEFIAIQDEYLTIENEKKGTVSLNDMKPVQKDLYLWQGDITRLAVDAIVNAANSGMTGCYRPCHNCIDNCIHTYAGVQLRMYCDDMMIKQGYEEPTGRAKITPAYNLPCKYVIHTVGPIVYDSLTIKEKEQLASCYKECLKCADENHCESIAFCCISTGVFMFPNDIACQIAVNTVKKYKKETNSSIKVVFNVFKDEDMKIYQNIIY